jgi:hypothetical protein
MEIDPNFEKLERTIREAFPSTAIPCGRSVVALDPSYDFESREIMQDFGGKSWTELSEKFLVHNISAVSFLSDSAFFYFLPSYLIHGSGDSSEAAFIRDTIVFHLVSVEYARDESGLVRELKALSQSQKDALGGCLNYWKTRFPEDCIDEEIDMILAHL